MAKIKSEFDSHQLAYASPMSFFPPTTNHFLADRYANYADGNRSSDQMRRFSDPIIQSESQERAKSSRFNSRANRRPKKRSGRHTDLEENVRTAERINPNKLPLGRSRFREGFSGEMSKLTREEFREAEDREREAEAMLARRRMALEARKQGIGAMMVESEMDRGALVKRKLPSPDYGPPAITETPSVVEQRFPGTGTKNLFDFESMEVIDLTGSQVDGRKDESSSVVFIDLTRDESTSPRVAKRKRSLSPCDAPNSYNFSGKKRALMEPPIPEMNSIRRPFQASSFHPQDSASVISIDSETKLLNSIDSQLNSRIPGTSSTPISRLTEENVRLFETTEDIQIAYNLYRTGGWIYDLQSTPPPPPRRDFSGH